jgi:hypothetical protein
MEDTASHRQFPMLPKGWSATILLIRLCLELADDVKTSRAVVMLAIA